jgi:hypothetical protein
MFRAFTIFTVAAAILIAAAAALAVAPGLDQNGIIASVTVAMAVVGAQARAVIRVSELYKFTGLRRSQIEQLIQRGLLKPFVPAPGARVRVVFADDVAHLQMMQAEAAEAATAAKTAAAEKPTPAVISTTKFRSEPKGGV